MYALLPILLGSSCGVCALPFKTQDWLYRWPFICGRHLLLMTESNVRELVRKFKQNPKMCFWLCKRKQEKYLPMYNSTGEILLLVIVHIFAKQCQQLYFHSWFFKSNLSFFLIEFDKALNVTVLVGTSITFNLILCLNELAFV